MFRSLSGVRAQYHTLTLVAVSEFDEWKVILYGPGVTIHGSRQFGEAKAKEHAVVMAQHYFREVRKEEPPELSSVEWGPTGPDDWLLWRG